MKKWLFLLIVSLSTAFAADLGTFTNTSKTWLGAVNGATELGFTDPVYLPNYGISISASKFGNYSKEWEGKFEIIKSLTTVFGKTIRGIEATEWLSLTVTYLEDNTQVTVRIKGADVVAGTAWEVFVNSVKEN
jgi:hypothetical protein